MDGQTGSSLIWLRARPWGLRASGVQAAASASRPALSPRYVHEFVEQLVGEDFHAKRVLSLANGVVGTTLRPWPSTLLARAWR